MKKIAFTVVAAVIVFALLLIFLQQEGSGPGGGRASDLAPGNTLVFFHLPDVQRSQARWSQTALAQIAAEPEVQAFLEKPRKQAPPMKEVDDTLGRFSRAKIGEAFLALTEADSTNAKFIAGFTSAGAKEDIQALLNPLRAQISTQADVKIGTETYNKHPIETYAFGGQIVALIIHGGGWTLVSNDPAALQAAIDRLDGKTDPAVKTLSKNAQFTAALATVPKESDLEVFADAEAISRRALPLVAASGTPVPAQAQDMIKQAKAFAYALKMDGAQFREAAFLVSPGGAAQPPLPLNTLAVSTAATAIVLANALPTASMISESSSMLSVMPGFADFEKALAAVGVKPEDFAKVFGREAGAVLDWPDGETAPTFALTVDLRDSAKLKAAVSDIAGNDPAWTKSEHAGALVLTQKTDNGLGLFQPSIGIGEKLAVLGLSTAGVNTVLDRATTSHERLDTSPAYQEAAKRVAKPTSTFAYIDVKAIFERTYGTVRPLALLALTLQPEVTQFIDAGKLPNTATIAKHLTPIVYSTSTNEHGTLVESSGPMTLSQVAMIFGGAAASVAASGEVKPGGIFDPSALGLPSIPGLTPPASKPPAPKLPTLPDPQPKSPKPEENPAGQPQ